MLPLPSATVGFRIRPFPACALSWQTLCSTPPVPQHLTWGTWMARTLLFWSSACADNSVDPSASSHGAPWAPPPQFCQHRVPCSSMCPSAACFWIGFAEGGFGTSLWPGTQRQAVLPFLPCFWCISVHPSLLVIFLALMWHRALPLPETLSWPGSYRVVKRHWPAEGGVGIILCQIHYGLMVLVTSASRAISGKSRGRCGWWLQTANSQRFPEENQQDLPAICEMEALKEVLIN